MKVPSKTRFIIKVYALVLMCDDLDYEGSSQLYFIDNYLCVFMFVVLFKCTPPVNDQEVTTRHWFSSRVYTCNTEAKLK